MLLLYLLSEIFENDDEVYWMAILMSFWKLLP